MTKGIIDYAMDDNGTEFRKSLYASIEDKVIAHIEAKKQEIAQGMLGVQKESIEMEEDISNYSLEEIQEFMQTEDYEQLDELSKKTLKSYIDKSSEDAANHISRKTYANGEINMIGHKMTRKKIGSDERNKMDSEIVRLWRRGNQEDDKGKKRLSGIKKATTRLAKESMELEEGRMPSVLTGTKIVKGGTFEHGPHKVEVRHNSEWQEYQVHHYKDGVHRGEGPVSYHGNDKEDAMDTAKWHHDKNKSEK